MNTGNYLFKTVLLTLLPIGLSIISCTTSSAPEITEPSWSRLGLSGITVFELNQRGDWVYVGTNQGLHKVDISSDSWETLGLNNATIRTFTVLSDGEILASSNISQGDSLTIAKRTTEGKWIPFRNGFGGGSRSIPLSLIVHPKKENILFARELFNVARSTDQGLSWESVYLTWEHVGVSEFVTIDPNNPDIIWAGGANSVFLPSLFKSEDGGETWNVLNENLQIFEGISFEGTAHSIVIKPGRSTDVLLGIDGIFRSTDGGENWESVYGNADIRVLTVASNAASTVYGSGQNTNNTLFVIASNNFGNTWQQFEMPDSPTGIQVNDMVSVDHGGREVLYLGTNKGLFSATFEE